ncbi:hypothetical protein [Streptacidiphilus carbonis]|uniref:hypothetical protein n=1 Tax=Streptacidiphilus carbonis TaxID=105422 RepID=UPI0005AB48A5|nr:hypothetical protein [Streptacidiphilus carbonis]
MARGRGRDGHPVALITLPDGQQIYGSVLARSRSWDGAWWYTVRITLTGREQRPGVPDRSQPFEVDFEARHPDVVPVEGQDYSQLPGARRPPGLLAVPSRTAHRRAGLEIHREGCWTIASRPNGMERVTQEQAEVLVGDGEARLCTVCLTRETRTP